MWHSQLQSVLRITWGLLISVPHPPHPPVCLPRTALEQLAHLYWV